MRRASLRLILALGLAGAAFAQPPAPATPELGLTLRPGVAPGGGGIDHVDVTLALGGAPIAAGAPLVQLPLVFVNVETVAAYVGDVAARDAAGALPLVVRDTGSGDDVVRTWSPGRTPEGAVTIRYRAPITGRTASRGAAPPLELRSEAGAFSGGGSTFLLLPPAGDTRYRLSVAWDLSGLPAGTVGVSSLGEGDVALAEPAPAARLARSFFMAGAIGHYPEHRDGGTFFSAWQGTPPFDARALMEWTGRLHARYVPFFRVRDVRSYGVFLRHNPVNAGGGIGLDGSFVATFGPNTDPEALKITLAHEMFHTFAPSIDDPEGLESSWFGEGLAVFYERVLPLRFGQIGVAAFLDDLNHTAARYYTNALGDAPNSEVPRRFWADTRIRTLPYDRGALYFAVVNDRMRKATHGRRSLDDLMLAMLDRQRAGRRLGNADWEDLLRRNLGETAVRDFRAFLAGHPPLPASDAFGPCFRRTTKPLRRYVLGFDPVVLVEPRRIVHGLIPGSAAAAAGLRDGDEIVRPVPQDAIQGNQTELLHLRIRRDGREFDLSYLPRGETVQAYQWERVAGVPDSACAI
jgi:predicted metalloprotease with PDZ domain